MSVINQMLRDLDSRDASSQERAGLPPRLRTLPPAVQPRGQQWRTLALGIGIGAALAGMLALLLRESSPPQAMVPLPPPAAVTAPAVPAPSAPLPALIDDGAMKLSTLLVPPEPPRPAPAFMSPPPVAKVAPAKPAAAAKPAAPAAGAVPAVTPDDVKIDKRSKDSPAREQAEAEYRKGMQAAKRGDPAAAGLLQHALEIDPTLAKARQALLSVLVSGKQWVAARQVVESGLALDPTQSVWAAILARLQLEQGDTAAAVATLERHAAHATTDADYQSLFAYLLQKQQRSAEAVERFRAALALRPGEARWWFGLGLAQEGAGQPDAAREAYGKARALGNLPPETAALVEQKLK